MHGPYTAQIRLRDSFEGAPDLSLSYGEMREAESIVWRYYGSGGGATKTGTTRTAAFYVGSLLQPGESATIEIVGFEGTGEKNPQRADAISVRRDESGRLYSSLGSRWARERHFIGA